MSSPQASTSKKQKRAQRNVHVTALDGVINVNSLFTIAIFMGLSFASPGQLQSLNVRKECQPGLNIAKQLVVFEILSFSSFLFSSLVAQSIKLSLNLRKHQRSDVKNSIMIEAQSIYIDDCMLTTGVMVSAMSSVVGCVFLVLSLVNVVEMKLGVLSCGAIAPIISVVFLVTSAAVGMIIYVFAAISKYVHHDRRDDVPGGADDDD